MPTQLPVSFWRSRAPRHQFLKDLHKLGYKRIVGIDEVGRGALAGPVVVAAIQLDQKIVGIHDSKLINRARRTELAEQIHRSSSQISFGVSSNEEIDEEGLSAALRWAYERALSRIQADLILTDNYFLPNLPHCKAIKGDSLFYSTAAASIVAKVYRDQLMRVYHHVWPHYAWDQNVGYATPNHKMAISKYGLTVLHRKSFGL